LPNEEDRVVGMICVEEEKEDVLVVSENGYGKRSLIGDYRITNRGGKGVKTMNITEKTGQLINIKGVIDTDDLMVITKSGTTIRLEVSKIRTTGRTTQGVRLINLREGESVASVAIVEENGSENDMLSEPDSD
jgi:DNA gyrase subunit A